MSNPIRQVVTFLNALMEASLPIEGVLYHGLTTLMVRNGETFPVPERQKRSTVIFPDSKIPLQIYHRINSTTEEQDDSNTWGFERETKTVANMSLYGIGIQEVIEKALEGINVDVAFQVFNSLPREGFAISTDIPVVNLTSFNLVTDQDTIIQTEFRNVGKLSRTKLNLVAFRIDYTIEADGCESCGEPLDLTANCADVVVTDGLSTVDLRPGDEYTCTSGGGAPEYSEIFGYNSSPATDKVEFFSTASFSITAIVNVLNAVGTVTANGVSKGVGDTVAQGEVVTILANKPIAGNAVVRLEGDFVDSTGLTTGGALQYADWTALAGVIVSSNNELGFDSSGLTYSAVSGVSTARVNRIFQNPIRIDWIASRSVAVGFTLTSSAPTSLSSFIFNLRDSGNNISADEFGSGVATISREGDDRLSIRIDGAGTVTYYVNNVLLYTSIITVPGTDLYMQYFYSGGVSPAQTGFVKVPWALISGMKI